MKVSEVEHKLARRQQFSTSVPDFLENLKQGLKQDLLKARAFYGIKRKDSYAKPYVRRFLKSYALLEYETFLKCIVSLAQYVKDHPQTVVVSSTVRLRAPLQRFAKFMGLPLLTETKRGMLTNLQQKNFKDLKSIFLVHDRLQSQLVKDARTIGATIVGLNNICRGIKYYSKLVVVNNFSEPAVFQALWLTYYVATMLKGQAPVSLETFSADQDV